VLHQPLTANTTDNALLAGGITVMLTENSSKARSASRSSAATVQHVAAATVLPLQGYLQLLLEICYSHFVLPAFTALQLLQLHRDMLPLLFQLLYLLLQLQHRQHDDVGCDVHLHVCCCEGLSRRDMNMHALLA
jgi:hypothetical protein